MEKYPFDITFVAGT